MASVSGAGASAQLDAAWRELQRLTAEVQQALSQVGGRAGG